VIKIGRTKEKQIKFYADEKEFQQIKKQIEKSKLSQQDYLLKCALDKNIIVIEDMKIFIGELKRIGNNLNQLTKVFNSEKILDTEELSKMNMELSEVWKEVVKTLKKVNG
jgi:ABC-type Fe3+-citrate transport system substrate-binding protein